MYVYSTKNKGDFFMIDLKNEDNKYHYRHNFLEFLNPDDFNDGHTINSTKKNPMYKILGNK
jgi:hypothetical protein